MHDHTVKKHFSFYIISIEIIIDRLNFAWREFTGFNHLYTFSTT